MKNPALLSPNFLRQEQMAGIPAIKTIFNLLHQTAVITSVATRQLGYTVATFTYSPHPQETKEGNTCPHHSSLFLPASTSFVAFYLISAMNAHETWMKLIKKKDVPRIYRSLLTSQKNLRNERVRRIPRNVHSHSSR